MADQGENFAAVRALATDHARRVARIAAARWAKINTTATLYAVIAAGGVIGSLGRWVAGLAFTGWFGGGFPYGTLFVNIVGSFIIGFFAELTGPDGRLFVGPRTRQFVMTGICGGFTTFSSFSLETVRFVTAAAPAMAAYYVAVSIVTWLCAVWAGEATAARLNRFRRG
jgi:CrcB protein